MNASGLAVAQAVSPVQNKLRQFREVEGTDGPLCCFASSKFTLCKLIGLFEANTHLNTFLRSPDGMKLSTRMGGEREHVAAWGDVTGHEERKRISFNEKVVPAIKTWGKGPIALTLRSAPLAFVHVWRQPEAADKLLQDGVPLMTCVVTPWTKHLVVVVRAGDGTNWLIDPWDKSDYSSVVSLGSGHLFTSPITVQINAGMATVPSQPMFHAYFVQQQTPLKSAIGI